MHLTKRQKEILDHIAEHLTEHGYAPTLEEIGEHFGLSSPATVHKHVQQLVRKGYVEKARHQGRGLEVVDPSEERPVRAPVRGRLGGDVVLEPESYRHVLVPAELAPSATVFVLEIQGDHFAPELMDGDLLVLEERDEVQDGERVVALTPEGVARVARFSQREGTVCWRATTDNGKDRIVPLTTVRVRGIVVGMLRRYRAPGSPATAR